MTPVAYYNENWTLTPAAYEEARGREAFPDMKPAYAAPAWEPLTPEVLERLQREEQGAQYWAVLRGYTKPVKVYTKRFAKQVCFCHGPYITYAEAVTHIQPFTTPEMPS